MPGATGMRSMRAADFVDTLGVVTHINSYPYDSPARIAGMLDYIGIHNIRQNSPVNSQSDLDLAELGRLGAKIDLLINGNGPVQLNYATDAVAAFLPWLNAIELPNEVDIFPIGYAGLTGMSAVMKFQQDVYTAIRSNPAYDHLDIYGFSMGGYPLNFFPELRDMSPYADYANVHAYAARGNTPVIDMPHSVEGWRQLAPHDPVVVTETGYYTSNVTAQGWGAVTENVQAQYLLDTAFGNAMRGVARTYFYDLIDDGPDLDERENNFGMFRYDGSAKPVAVAFHNLTTLLADHGPTAESFNTEAVAYSVSGLSSFGGSLLLEKSDGVHVLAVWNEQDLWNEATSTEIAASHRVVRINLDRAYDTVLVFDPMLGTEAIASYEHASTIALSLAAHPLIVQFGDDAGRTHAPSSGPGDDTLVLRVAEEAWQGHVQFTVKMDGQQLGGVHTISAAPGRVQEFVFTGHFNDVNSRVTVDFLNDAYTPGEGDRNMFVEQILLNGHAVHDSARILYGGGPVDFYLPASLDTEDGSHAPGAPAPGPGSGSVGVRPQSPPAAIDETRGSLEVSASDLMAVGRGNGHFTHAPGTDRFGTFTFTDAHGTARHVTLDGAARVDFADGWMEFDGTGPGATVARLYHSILGRAPDAAGLAFQVDALDRVGAESVAAGILGSPEGQMAANSSAASYVSRLYELQLGRAPEASAVEYWTARMEHGLSRANLAVSIATSAEAGLDRVGLTAQGLSVSRLKALEVYEAYAGVLGRRAEAAGLSFWVDRREEGATKSEIAHALAGSAEFRNYTSALSDADFIETLYRNALGREAEQDGLTYYEHLLSGGLTRADLAAAFQESSEAAAATLRLADTGLNLL